MHITFARSFLPHLDSRMQKYVNSLKRRGHSVSFIGWARDQKSLGPSDDEIRLFTMQARLGARWANLLSLVCWNLFVLRNLFDMRARISAVHAVDFDSALAAWVFCCAFRKPLIFDIYDHYADTREISGPARTIITALEGFLARHAQLTLLADESRYEQHCLSPADNILVIENVPDSDLPWVPLDDLSPGPIRIGYFGVLEARHRGLEMLLEAFGGRTEVELHFAGYGQLEENIAAASERYDNVKMHGPLSHKAGLEMLSKMHCMAGFYHLSVPNHRYAAPNKYYEHLLLGRPLLTTKGTPPGDKVTKGGTGWSIGEHVEDLHRWLAFLTLDEIAMRSRKAREVWDEKYRSYAREIYSSLYCHRLEALSGHVGSA